MGVSHLLEHMVFKGTERRTRARSSRSRSRSAAAASTPTPAATTPAIRPTCSTSDLPAGRRHPHRPGPPAAAPPSAIWSSSGTSSSRRSTASRTRPTTSSSSCTPRRCGRSTRTATRSWAPATRVGALDGRRPAGAARDGLLPRQLRGRRRGQRRARPAARRRWSAEGWFDGRRREPAASSRRAGPARRGVERRARRATPPRPTSCSAPTRSRSRDPRRFALAMLDERVRRRHVEPAVPAGPRGARAGLRRLSPTSSFYQSSGQLGVYVGTQPASADQAVEAIRAEYDRLAREGLPADELGRRQAAAQGADHAVAGEPDQPDGPAGGLQRCTTSRIGRSTRCSPRSTR